MRCFVALDLPPPVRNHLARVTAPLRERFDLKWVRPEHMHLTLLFAGELAETGVDALRHALDEADLQPLELALERFGVFPPRGTPRVVWAGLAGRDVDRVVALQQELADAGEALDVPRDRRPFTPHVTIARLKSSFGAYALADRLQELDAELNQKPFAVPSLTIYRSTLTPSGPRYDVVHERRL